jgi:glutamate dehydrogenase
LTQTGSPPTQPESISIANVGKLFDADGKPHFKAVVEGANLFFTQQARLHLEKKGVIVFKDSSANKGGVTSSSLEVLAGLGLTDEEYLELMVHPSGTPSKFCAWSLSLIFLLSTADWPFMLSPSHSTDKSYVKDIQEKIAENGAVEFEGIWKEHIRRKGASPRTLLSDELSSTLNALQVELEESHGLYELEASTKAVLRMAIPKTLVDHVGLETLIQRLPEQYLRALWSAYVSSHFIYLNGIGASQVDFFLYFSQLSNNALSS